MPMTREIIKDTLDQLRGAVIIVFPMGLPSNEDLRS